MIPAFVTPRPIEHILVINGQRIRIFGNVDLEGRVITASVTLADRKPANPNMDLDVKRGLHQLGYNDYKITLQY